MSFISLATDTKFARPPMRSTPNIVTLILLPLGASLTWNCMQFQPCNGSVWRLHMTNWTCVRNRNLSLCFPSIRPAMDWFVARSCWPNGLWEIWFNAKCVELLIYLNYMYKYIGTLYSCTKVNISLVERRIGSILSKYSAPSVIYNYHGAEHSLDTKSHHESRLLTYAAFIFFKLKLLK